MDSIPEECIAAGGVVKCSDTGLILLIKRNGVWDLPKGKLENGETIPECAVREVEEETGLENLRVTAALCNTYHEYKQNNRLIGKTTYWYLMEEKGVSKQALKPQTEEGITNLAWEETEKSREILGYNNLKKVIDTLEKISK